MTLKIGNYENSKKFAEAILEVVDVPEVVRVTDIATGIMEEGTSNERYWANFTAADNELYRQFESIEQEDYCPTFKVKLKNYRGEDLSDFQDAEFSLDNYELSFTMDKFKQPNGLALVLDINNILIK